MTQRAAKLHPAIDARASECIECHGTTFTRVCNAALWHFFHVADADARHEALQTVKTMLRSVSQKQPRRKEDVT
jgi:hypothetical protein